MLGVPLDVPRGGLVGIIMGPPHRPGCVEGLLRVLLVDVLLWEPCVEGLLG